MNAEIQRKNSELQSALMRLFNLWPINQWSLVRDEVNRLNYASGIDVALELVEEYERRAPELQRKWQAEAVAASQRLEESVRASRLASLREQARANLIGGAEAIARSRAAGVELKLDERGAILAAPAGSIALRERLMIEANADEIRAELCRRARFEVIVEAEAGGNGADESVAAAN